MDTGQRAALPASVLAGVLLAVPTALEPGGRPSATQALCLLVGASFVGAGAWAWARRPADGTGRLLVWTGVAWLASLLAWSGRPLLFTFGAALSVTYAALLGQLLLSFPGGRLTSTTAKVLTAAAWLDALVFQVVAMTLIPNACDCPANLLLVSPRPELAETLAATQIWIGLALCAAVVVVLARRWWLAPPPARRATTPLVCTGALAVLTFGWESLADVVPGAVAPMDHVYLIALAAVPLSLLAGLLRARLAHAAVARLVVELGGSPPPAQLRDALARGLGDPGLDLAFWVPEQARYVDLDGAPVTLPEAGGPRAATTVHRDGQPIAALVHDVSLCEDPALLDAVAAAAALALVNARLQAELRARLADLAASRARLVEAAEAERRRIERNLHDGTQARLTSVSMALGLAASRLDGNPEQVRGLLEEAREGLSTALGELRRLSQGIHPAVLTERGLAVALKELAYGAPLPVELDARVAERPAEALEAAAYFVAAEALANLAKHAGATLAHVRVAREGDQLVVVVRDDGRGGADPARGTGLAGLADRVAALGGRLDLTSPVGGGTRVEARLPWEGRS